MQEWAACDGMKRYCEIVKYASDSTISRPIVKLAQRQPICELLIWAGEI